MSAAIHLAVIVQVAPAPHVVGSWRLPRSGAGFDYHGLDYWTDIARTLERGRFDMLFFADGYNLWDYFRGTPDAALEYAVQYPKHDPVPLMGHLAAQAPHLGLGLTHSTAFAHPYAVARLFASLDFLTRGRIGWNVVASSGKNEYLNFGIEDYPDHAERYGRTEEFIELCYQLWDTWEEGAVLADRESGRYADPGLIHPVDFQGKHFRSRGVLPVPRSPQGRPVILQAGGSPQGRGFAARHAEVIFAVRGSGAGMRSYRDTMVKEYVAAGRKPEDVRLLWGVNPVVGETEMGARDRQRAIQDGASLDGCLALLSGQLGFDFSTVPLDEPLANFEAEGIVGLIDAVKNDFNPDATLREVAARYGSGLGGPTLVGTGRQVADQLEALFDEAGGDGFMLTTTGLPSSVHDFVDLVVPELQRRGRLRRSYRPGAQLRDLILEEEA